MKSAVPFVAIPPSTPRERTVLLVDDDPDIRATMQAFLRGAMREVRLLSAASGPEALEVLARERVDVIITDFRMPGMDGLVFLDRAKAIAPSAIRLMLTAYPDVELAKKAINDEAVVKFLTKPIEPPALAAALRQALDAAAAREALERQFREAERIA